MTDQDPTLPGMPAAGGQLRRRTLGADDLQPTGMARMAAALAGVTIPAEWRTTLEPHTREVTTWRLSIIAPGPHGNVGAVLDHANSRPEARRWAVWSTIPGPADHGPTPQAAVDAYAERLAAWRRGPT